MTLVFLCETNVLMKFLSTILFIVIAVFSQAQNSSGVIVYKEIINTKPDLKKAEEQGWAEWATMVPDSVVFQRKLVFNNTISSYTNIPIEENPDEQNFIKMMMRRYANANNETYSNSETGVFIEKKDFMGKSFIIKGKEEIKWKMTGEMKPVLGYSCLKAIYEDTTGTLEAWFTTEIPISKGPEKYLDLPGMILEVYISKEKRTLSASEITFKEIKSDEFREPTEGKIVTREEFHQIVKEKMEEMRKSGGFGGMGRPR